MRIAHIVTLISADNAFGGPVSVASNQAAELARRGHEVTLLAGWDGVAEFDLPDVDVRLHRSRTLVPSAGFSGLAAPGVLRALRAMAPRLDVVHVHLARDLVTMTAARAMVGKRPRLVTQTHGMVMPDRRPIARITDALATRAVLQRAAATAALTEAESAGLREVAGPDVAVVDLPNGIDLREIRQPAAGGRARITFCARLHPRKRVLAFAEMAKILIDAGVDAQFVVAGPDEGDLNALRDFIRVHDLVGRLEYLGAIPPHQVRDLLAASAVFVLPSDREPFPMTLLEAMAEGTPSVITTGCMIADRFTDAGGPHVTDGTPAQLATSVLGLLGDPDRSREVGRRSRELIAEHFSIESVVDQLESIYRTAAPGAP